MTRTDSTSIVWPCTKQLKRSLEYMCAGHEISEFKSCQLSGHNKCVQKHLTVGYFNCSYVKGSNTETNIEVVNLSLEGGR